MSTPKRPDIQHCFKELMSIFNSLGLVPDLVPAFRRLKEAFHQTEWGQVSNDNSGDFLFSTWIIPRVSHDIVLYCFQETSLTYSSLPPSYKQQIKDIATSLDITEHEGLVYFLLPQCIIDKSVSKAFRILRHQV
jgi:hypothetical protein